MGDEPLLRLRYAAAAVATIALGLAVHFRGESLGTAARDVVGDALWAAMIVWWVSSAAPRASRRARALVALAICFAVEGSQRLHSPSIDLLRATPVGHLALGSDFDARDLAAYAAGVFGALAIESAMLGRRRRGERESGGRQGG